MQKITKIIVAGCDEVALLVAATLAFNLRHIEIVLVDAVPKTSGRFVESSMENINAFLGLAGIDINSFIADTQATFKLGNYFTYWAGVDHHLNHAFGDYGIASGNIDFHQAMVKLHQSGIYKKYSDFSLSARAAAAGKFATKQDVWQEGLPAIASGLHFSIPAFVQFLSNHLRRLGVKRIAEEVATVNLTADGSISSLTGCSGKTIAADFYIDCTGNYSKLLGKAMAVDFLDWKNCLRVNRCVGAIEPIAGVASPLTKITVAKNCWIRQVGLRDLSSAEIFYNTNDSSEEQSRAMLKGFLKSEQALFSKEIAFSPGRRVRFWEKNCLAIGESVVSLAQFSHSSLFIAQALVARFLDYFPSREQIPELTDEYNRIAVNEVERIYDYHCLHYWLLKKSHSLAIKNKEFLSEMLIEKLDVFQASGRLVKYEEDNIASSQWLSLLLGMNVWPDRYDPVVDNFSSEQLRQASEMLSERIQLVVANMQPHEIYLANIMKNKNKR